MAKRTMRRPTPRSALQLTLALAVVSASSTLPAAAARTAPHAPPLSWASSGMHLPPGTPVWTQTYHDAQHTGFDPSESFLSPSDVSQLQPIGGVSVPGAVYADAFDNGELFALGPGTGSGATLSAFSRSGALLWSTVSGSYNVFNPGTTMAAAQGLVFVACSLGSPGDMYDGVCAYHESNGSLAWSYSNPCHCVPESTDITSPTYANGVIYFAYQNGNAGYSAFTTAIDAASGTVLYSHQVSNGPNFIWYGYAPAVAGGYTYYSCYNAVCAFAASGGGEVWQTPTPTYENALTVAGGIVIDHNVNPFGPNYCNVIAFNGATGKQLAEYTYGSSCANGPEPPAVGNGVIYVSSGTTGLYAISAKTGQLVWSGADYAASSPTLANGVLYVSGGDANSPTVSAYKAATGAVLWNGPDGATYNPAPMIVDGILIAAADDSCGDLCAYTVPKMHAHGAR